MRNAVLLLTALASFSAQALTFTAVKLRFKNAGTTLVTVQSAASQDTLYIRSLTPGTVTIVGFDATGKVVFNAENTANIAAYFRRAKGSTDFANALPGCQAVAAAFAAGTSGKNALDVSITLSGRNMFQALTSGDYVFTGEAARNSSVDCSLL